MSTPNTPFTAIYTQWLESFRALLPGHKPAEPTPKEERVAAAQEWEDEGGSLRPAEAKEAGKTGTVPDNARKVRES